MRGGMKKLLFILFFFFILSVGGLVFFLITFDLNRYKPFVVGQIEKALACPVTIESLSLGFRGGIAVELKKVALYPSQEAMERPVVTVEEVKALLKLSPLFKRRLEWTAVRFVRPRLHLVRDKEGRIAIEGRLPSIKKAETLTDSAPPHMLAATIPFLVENIWVEGGEIRVSDGYGPAPMDVTLRQITANLLNLSLARPSQFLGRLAFLSDQPNLRLNGILHLPTAGRSGFLEDFEVEFDLGTVKMSELIRAFPALSEMGLKEGFAGKLRVTVPALSFSPGGRSDWKAEVNLSEGSFVLSEVKSRLQGVILKATADSQQLNVQSLYLTVAQGEANLSGRVSYATSPPISEINAKLQGLVLDELLAVSHSEKPRIRGLLSLSFQGGARGGSWPSISQSLGGQGWLKLAEGRVENLNVLREVFQKLSVLPGLVEKLESRLPASYGERLKAKHTTFQPLELSFAVGEGAVFFRELRVVADNFELHGSGRLGLDGTLACQADLVIDPDLSLAFIKSVNELEYLLVDGRRLGIPVTLRGKLGELRVLPDLKYVAGRVAVVKTTEVVTGLVQKALEKKGLPPARQ